MKQEQTSPKFDWSVLNLAWRMGYTIAIPLVVLALGGRLLDRALKTSPTFLLIGILVSIALSTLGVYRITIPIMSDLAKPQKKSRPENKTTTIEKDN